MIDNAYINLVYFVINLTNKFISILLIPLDNILSVLIPNYNTLSGYVVNLFNYFYDTFLFFLNWIHLPSSLISIIIGYITFRVVMYFGSLSIKLALKWYHYLKI